MQNRTCSCGSGLEREELLDARGIFCGYGCSKCLEHLKSKYRSEIFTDCNYESDEPVEPEEY